MGKHTSAENGISVDMMESLNKRAAYKAKMYDVDEFVTMLSGIVRDRLTNMYGEGEVHIEDALSASAGIVEDAWISWSYFQR